MKEPIMPHSVRSALVVVALTIVPAFAEDVEVPDTQTVLAQVGDTAITLGHVIHLASTQYATFAGLYNISDEDALDMVLEDLIAQEAYLQQLRASNQPLPKWVDLAIDNARRSLLLHERQTQIFNSKPKPTDQEIEAKFDRDYREFNASHILVDTEREARILIERHAMDAPGSAASDLGWFELKRMVPEFSAAVRALSVGSISDPVQTQFGWHVIRLNDVRNKKGSEGATLEDPDFRNVLVRKIQDETFRDELDMLKERFGVTIPEHNIDPSLIWRTDLLFD
jgi:peptidyl-prolyl cis-trans isomerase C